MPEASPPGTPGAPGPVVFLGSDAIAAACLEPLAAAAPVALAVTPPERRRRRRAPPTPTAVAVLAAGMGIPVLATADVNDPESMERLRQARPGLLAVVAFGQYLKRPLLALPELGAVNVHFSVLPRWRGAAPVHRAILAGDDETGVTVQRMGARLDAGPMLGTRREPIGSRDDTPTLQGRLTAAGAELLTDIVTAILGGRPPEALEQDESLVTQAPRVTHAEGGLDPTREDARGLDRRIRALGAWPGCRAVLHAASGGSLPVRVRAAVPETGPAGEPGAVLAADAGGIVVAAASGALRITRLQRPGGRELAARDFLNGWPVVPGDRLTAPG